MIFCGFLNVTTSEMITCFVFFLSNVSAFIKTIPKCYKKINFFPTNLESELKLNIFCVNEKESQIENQHKTIFKILGVASSNSIKPPYLDSEKAVQFKFSKMLFKISYVN